MQAIKAIFLKDVRLDLYSHKGGILIFCFLFLLGYFFYNSVDTFISIQNSHSNTGLKPPSVSELILSFFSIMHIIFLIITPAITMNTFSEEIKSNTIKLLLSSPIQSFEIVLGKFFSAIFIVYLILVSSLVFPLYLSLHSICDWKTILSSYLGLLLIQIFHVSFGQFISSLMQNNVLSYLVSALGIIVMTLLNSISFFLKKDSTLEHIIRNINTAHHLKPFFKGILTTNDFLFFVLASCLALIFTTISLDHYRWK